MTKKIKKLLDLLIYIPEPELDPEWGIKLQPGQVYRQRQRGSLPAGTHWVVLISEGAEDNGIEHKIAYSVASTMEEAQSAFESMDLLSVVDTYMEMLIDE